MHILYFHQHFSTPSGSTGTRSYEMARALVARGHKVTMVCGASAMGATGLSGTPQGGIRKGVVDGIKIVELDLPYSNHDGFVKRSWIFVLFALRSIRLALTEEYDLLFATSTPLTAGIPGIVMKLFRKKPFVFEVRDLWPELPREMGVITNPLVLWGMGVLEWSSYHSADACIGLSPGICKGIIRRGISPERVVMVPNGCDLDLFSPKLREPLDLPGISHGDLVALFCGAHGIANGLDAVLNAAAELKSRKESGIKLVFIGDGKLKPKLIERAKREGLDNCLFYAPMPKTKLSQVLASVDIGLMILMNVPAFYHGTSPNKFFDYIASGLPVLNNYPGWLAELISDHKCGVAVPPDDPNAFADALVSLRDNPALRKQMAKQSRVLADSQFDRFKLAGEFATTLERCFEKFKRSA